MQAAFETAPPFADRINYAAPSVPTDLVRAARTITIDSDRTTYQPGQTVVIDVALSSTGTFVDLHRSYMTLHLATVNNTFSLQGSIRRILERVRILNGQGVVLEDITDANILCELIDQSVPKPWLDSCGGTAGYHPSYDATYRTALAAGRTFAVPLNFSGFLSTDRLLPMQAIGVIRVEITLASAATALFRVAGGAGAAGYTVSNTQLHLVVVQMGDDIARAVSELSRRGQLKIPYFSYASNNFQLANGNNSLDIRKGASDLRSLFAVQRVTANISDQTTDSFASVTITTLTDVQLRFGSQSYPERPMAEPVRMYLELRKAWNQLGNVYHPAVPFTEYLISKGSVGIDLESDPSTSLTGVSTRAGNYLQLSLTTTTANTTLTTFVLYTKILSIGDGFALSVSE